MDERAVTFRRRRESDHIIPLPEDSVAMVFTHLPFTLGAGETIRALTEILRILEPSGRAFIITNVVRYEGGIEGRQIQLQHLLSLMAQMTPLLQPVDIIAHVNPDPIGRAPHPGSYGKPSAPLTRGAWWPIVYAFNAAGPYKRTPPPRHSTSSLTKRVRGVYDDSYDESSGSWSKLLANHWEVGQDEWGREYKDWERQFPVGVAERALRLATWPGEIVCDPYCGRGAVGEAASRLGRKAILFGTQDGPQFDGLSPDPPEHWWPKIPDSWTQKPQNPA